MAKDPKTGTGKKPKGSGRRLYTDENPKDTVGIKFATPADARATVAKVKRVRKPFARKIQILTVGEQRAKVMGKSQVASIFKKGKDSIGEHMAKKGLRSWVKENWVDIANKKKDGSYPKCGRSGGEKRKNYPKCVPIAKARAMSKGQRKGAVARKQAVANTGPKPSRAATFAKKRKKK